MDNALINELCDQAIFNNPGMPLPRVGRASLFKAEWKVKEKVSEFGTGRFGWNADGAGVDGAIANRVSVAVCRMRVRKG